VISISLLCVNSCSSFRLVGYPFLGQEILRLQCPCGPVPIQNRESSSLHLSSSADTKEPSPHFALPAPNLDLDPLAVVRTCMDSLKNVDDPYHNAGLEINFDFASERCRAAMGGDLPKFISFARNSVFSSMVGVSKVWSFSGDQPLSPIIPGSVTRGDMVTVLVEVIPHPEASKEEARHFLWTLQKERRPPKQGMWLVLECICVENAFELTL